jgi:N-acetylglucosaminyldiphosphoundecaprenol N-acetyl-beta-D-mannosaminyltransferase
VKSVDDSLPTKRALGIDFFDGSAEEAVEWVSRNGGLVVAPAAPSFVALQDDPDYRRAIADADLAIADSGWMVNFWWLLQRERLTRISGLKFFKCLLELLEVRTAGNLFWVLPSETAKQKTLAWAQSEGFPLTSDDLYVAPRYLEGRPPCRPSSDFAALTTQQPGRDPASAVPYGVASSARPSIEDTKLLGIVHARKPKHIVIAIGGGMQDKIGNYIKQNCRYRPGIYCIGAAPGFVTGDQVRIPMWADRFFVGWIFRIFAQPRTLGPRFWGARRLPWLILRYGRELPIETGIRK